MNFITITLKKYDANLLVYEIEKKKRIIFWE